MSKHTPGPWSIHHKPRCDWQIVGADEYSIVGVPDDDKYGRPTEDAANARLIAAAPDLLAFVKRFTSNDECTVTEPGDAGHCHHCDAINLIAKADGK